MSGRRWAAAFLGAVVMTTASLVTPTTAPATSSDRSGVGPRLCAFETRVDRRLGKLEARVQSLEAHSANVEVPAASPKKCRRAAPVVLGRYVHRMERATERRVAALEARVEVLEEGMGQPVAPGGRPRLARPGAPVPHGSRAVARRIKGFERSFRKRSRGLTLRISALETLLAPSGPGPSGGAQAVRDNAGPRGAVPRPTGAVAINPGDNIQAKLDAGGPHATFWFTAGTHRISSTAVSTAPIRPKDGQVLAFESGAVLKGSRIVANWTQEGSHWVSTGHTQDFSSAVSSFQPSLVSHENPSAAIFEDLFYDAAPLSHVLDLEALAPGKVYFDRAAGRMYISDNPTGHTLEATNARAILTGPGDGVVIRGGIFEHAADDGIRTAGGNDWVIEDNEIRYCHIACLSEGGGSRRTVVRHNYIHHGGALAVVGHDSDGALFEANEFAFGNYLGFGGRPNPRHEGGVKLLRHANTTFRGNWSHDHDGDGLWLDYDNRNVLIEGNVFENNTRWGFFYEASYAALVRENLLANNGVDGPFGGWGSNRGGIILSTSKDVRMTNNVLDLNISFSLRYRWDSRGSGTLGTFELVNNEFYDNEIRFRSEKDTDTRAEIVSVRDVNKTAAELASNTFDHNRYKTPNPAESWWFWPTAHKKTFSQWQSVLGHDANGTNTQLA